MNVPIAHSTILKRLFQGFSWTPLSSAGLDHAGAVASRKRALRAIRDYMARFCKEWLVFFEVRYVKTLQGGPVGSIPNPFLTSTQAAELERETGRECVPVHIRFRMPSALCEARKNLKAGSPTTPAVMRQAVVAELSQHYRLQHQPMTTMHFRPWGAGSMQALLELNKRGVVTMMWDKGTKRQRSVLQPESNFNPLVRILPTSHALARFTQHELGTAVVHPLPPADVAVLRTKAESKNLDPHNIPGAILQNPSFGPAAHNLRHGSILILQPAPAPAPGTASAPLVKTPTRTSQSVVTRACLPFVRLSSVSNSAAGSRATLSRRHSEPNHLSRFIHSASPRDADSVLPLGDVCALAKKMVRASRSVSKKPRTQTTEKRLATYRRMVKSAKKHNASYPKSGSGSGSGTGSGTGLDLCVQPSAAEHEKRVQNQWKSEVHVYGTNLPTGPVTVLMLVPKPGCMAGLETWKARGAMVDVRRSGALTREHHDLGFGQQAFALRQQQRRRSYASTVKPSDMKSLNDIVGQGPDLFGNIVCPEAIRRGSGAPPTRFAFARNLMKALNRLRRRR